MKKADILFVNGVVVTVDHNDSICEAVAVNDNRISFVGSNEAAKEWIGESTKVINLNGKAILPGFIDSHIHYSMVGLKQGTIIDIDYDKAPSIEVIREKIKADVANKKPGEWVSLWGYDQNKLSDGRHPTAADFDDITPNNPVICIRACGHMSVFNSYALKLGRINNEAGFLPGEVVMADGKPEGLLKDGAAMYMNQIVIYSENQVMEGLKAADRIMAENGITSIHDAGPGTTAPMVYKLMERGARNGDLKTRFNIMIFDLGGKESNKQLIDHFIEAGIMSGFGNERFKIGPCKIMLDGSSSGPSSNMKEPYNHDPELPGIQVWNEEEVAEEICKVHTADYQMTGHALGDRAVEFMIKGYEKAYDEYNREDCRHRIEHCGFADANQVARIAKLGLVPIANPGFIELNGRDYNRYYGDRVNYMFPLKWYKEEGIKAAIGSDCPVTPPNPMLGLWGAVNRADGRNYEAVGENQKVDILTAIRMYTYNGAYAAFEEEIKGSIEVGKLADLVVLSENILETPPMDIRRITAEMTIIDGEIVYSK